VDVGDVTVETFAGREGQRFWIKFSDAELDLELAEVNRVPDDWGRPPEREPFAVVFHGTLEHVLPQQIWPVDHEELGRIEMFLAPIGPTDTNDAMQYEAVFS
jgi:hypothetical protein